ncbi:hypothetical protein JTE90_024090 [Oedothorax gibbosus]|uniref:Uncharacterized protein n=1 Tax=Oedothorax gibbosus TaxID=931172 RepID=A0AAV6URU6_9ARAC|nr:hypothetical protein JTE90_024090 [Oedothorax gibbosus]
MPTKDNALEKKRGLYDFFLMFAKGSYATTALQRISAGKPSYPKTLFNRREEISSATRGKEGKKKKKEKFAEVVGSSSSTPILSRTLEKRTQEEEKRRNHQHPKEEAVRSNERNNPASRDSKVRRKVRPPNLLAPHSEEAKRTRETDTVILRLLQHSKRLEGEDRRILGLP